MALTIGTIDLSVVGSKRMNSVTVTAATTGKNAMTPEQVGLHKIEGVFIIGGASDAELWVDYDGTNLILGDETGEASSGTAKLAFVGV